MKRRRLLQQLGLASAATAVAIGTHGVAFRTQAQSGKPKRLVVVMLRGAIDGLSVVVPYREDAYYQGRPTIAIPPPSKQDGALDLDGQFGLNPVLKPLMPLWRDRTLAFVHACGSPDPTRSHFDAQDYLESGTPGVKNTRDGWMNRLLGELPKTTLTQALNVGRGLPRILSGSNPVATIELGRNAPRPLAIDGSPLGEAFDRLYQGSDRISRAYREGRTARQRLLDTLDATGEDNAESKDFARSAQQLAQLMRSDPGMQLAFLELGGWDTHVTQKGQLDRKLERLGGGLATLASELGEVYGDTAIAVISEFGRTAKENGNKGTDHGRGNAMWLLGGGIRGGRVYGRWPGLAESQLYEKRDLQVTTDFRDAIATLLESHLNLGSDRIARVFPDYEFNLVKELT